MGLLRLIKYTSLASLLVIFAGCSSDSAAPAAGATPASYSGSSTQASITSENSEDMAESMMDGASGAEAAASASGSDADNEQLVGAIRRIRSAIQNVDTSSPTLKGNSFAEVFSLPATTETSDCGGSVTTSFVVDTDLLTYEMTMSFSSYVDCGDKSTMHGSMTVKGGYNPADYSPTSMKATFTALTYTDASESMTMTGEMDMVTLSNVSYKTTMNLDVRDNNANETYRLVNYITTVTEDSATNPTYGDMTISGQFYHPTHGFIAISTTTTLHFTYPDLNPSTGVVELLGTGGTKATMTMLTNDTYRLEIDTDGDTTIDITKNCTWSTNVCTTL